VRRPRVASGFPLEVDHALRYSRVVVVAVTVPGAPVDTLVRREARAGAQASRAGFVALSASNERAVSALVAKTGVLPAPAVVIVKRPGVVTSTFSVTDAGTIAQAVAQASR
jgi:TPP-dependent indolepyruvate ferredoxin oxidoreductase alpha subunit